MGPACAAYRHECDDCWGSKRTRAPLHTYGRGLLSHLPRTSVAPIALAAATAVRTLPAFVRAHVLLDETGTVKKGTKTPSGQRPGWDAVGKTANGLGTVPGGSRGRFQTLLDADLYGPQAGSQDRPRGKEAGIPDRLVYRAQ